MNFKQYNNRKIYSVVTHNYVKTTDVWNSFMLNPKVRVVDHDTGEDVTVKVLLDALKKTNISVESLYEFGQKLV